MSNDQRRRLIGNGSISRLRDRQTIQQIARLAAHCKSSHLKVRNHRMGATPRRPTRKWRGDSAVQKRSRRHRLISEALRKHGVGAVARLEKDFGDDLRVDVQLEHLIDADPLAIALLEAAR